MKRFDLRVLVWSGLSVLLITGGVVVIMFSDQIFGTTSYVDGVEVSDPVEKSNRPLQEGEIPQEKTVGDDVLALHTVLPEDIRYLRSSDLSTVSRVVVMGLYKNTIQSPANTNDVGWYKSHKPTDGSGELIAIDGHVSGRRGKGVFHDLDQLKDGSKIELEYGDGKKRTFSVRSHQSVKRSEPAEKSLLSPVASGESVLRLITCAGRYNRDLRTYEDRLIIEAIEVK